ncbi:MAG: GNAT family N-acetyltransferase [Alphaproteobacteria bacterium]|nr:MAG: GNAT family N-acetyltransferase [Alphaproteobacteria bacterium]
MIKDLPADFSLRAVADTDADGLITLIGNCFGEYEGVYLEPDGLDSDLRAYASYLADIKGAGYIIEKNGEIVAVVSCAPIGAGRWQLKRIYLGQALRGTGLGPKLLKFIEDFMRAAGAESIELWSDTRFSRAHRFYEREGYEKQAQTRDLHDSSNTTEFYFIKRF